MSSAITQKLQVIGPWRLSPPLGFNGLIVTFEGTDMTTQQRAVLHVVHKGYVTSPSAWSRFQSEFREIASTSHATVCSPIKFGEEAGHYYAAYEWVEGNHLGMRIRDHGLLSTADSFRVIAQVADGLAYLHRKGSPHRLLNPASIFIDTQGNVRLLHGGWTRVISGIQEGLRNPALNSILPFVAPEVAAGKDGDETSDVYSLGANLFFMVSGQPPQWHDDPTTLADMIASTIPDFKLLDELIPPQAVELIEELMAHNPDDRPVNLPALSDRLKSMAREIEALEKVQAEKVVQEAAAAAAQIMASAEEEPPHVPAQNASKPRLPKPSAAALQTPPPPQSTARGSAKKSPPKGVLIGAGAAILLLVVGGLAYTFLGGGEEEPVPTPKPTTTTKTSQPAGSTGTTNPTAASPTGTNVAQYDETTARLRAMAQLAIAFQRRNGSWPQSVADLQSMGATPEELKDSWGNALDVRAGFVLSSGANKKWDDDDDVWWDFEKNLRGGFTP